MELDEGERRAVLKADARVERAVLSEEDHGAVFFRAFLMHQRDQLVGFVHDAPELYSVLVRLQAD